MQLCIKIVDGCLYINNLVQHGRNKPTIATSQKACFIGLIA
ncbi:hypothetical protein [Calothrix sp. PCC 6303]|nr:hypothetical protein [Calothrix sp. PCC 6303]